MNTYNLEEIEQLIKKDGAKVVATAAEVLRKRASNTGSYGFEQFSLALTFQDKDGPNIFELTSRGLEDTSYGDTNDKKLKFSTSTLPLTDENYEKTIGACFHNIDGLDEFVQLLLAKCAPERIFNLRFNDILKNISLKFPIYEELIKGFNLRQVSNSNVCPTLRCTWDNNIKNFVIEYNPIFILEGTLKEFIANKDRYKSLATCYVYFVTFTFMHEVSHIIRYHLSPLSKVEDRTSEGGLSNTIGDSFINVNLAKMLGNSSVEGVTAKVPYNAYGTDIIIHGVLKPEVKESGMPFVVENWKRVLQKYKTRKIENLDIEVLGYFGSLNNFEEDYFTLKIGMPNSEFIDFFGNNSITYIRFCEDFFNSIADKFKSVEDTAEKEPKTIGDILHVGVRVRINTTGDEGVVTAVKENPSGGAEVEIFIDKVPLEEGEMRYQVGNTVNVNSSDITVILPSGASIPLPSGAPPPKSVTLENKHNVKIEQPKSDSTQTSKGSAKVGGGKGGKSKSGDSGEDDEQTKSGDEEEPKPGEPKSGESKPVEAKPGEPKSGESKPVEAKPVEAKPGEAKPGEAKPEGKSGEAGAGAETKKGKSKPITNVRDVIERIKKDLNGRDKTVKDKIKEDAEEEGVIQKPKPSDSVLDRVQSDSEKRDAIKDIVSKAVERGKRKIEDIQREVGGSEASTGIAGRGENETDLLRDLGAGKVAVLSETIGKWSDILYKLLRKALGFTSKYKSSAPHGRVEGQLGRSVTARKIKSIVISIDCSGSMGAKEFLQVLGEIQTFFKVARLQGVIFHIVYWGGNERELTYKKFRYSNDLVQKIKLASPSYGGTVLAHSFAFIKNKIKKPDAVIICTDGQISDYESDKEVKEILPYVRSKRNRFIWVLTMGGQLKDIQKVYDPGAKQRFIKQTKRR